jgi:hypothetical protein
MIQNCEADLNSVHSQLLESPIFLKEINCSFCPIVLSDIEPYRPFLTLLSKVHTTASIFVRHSCPSHLYNTKCFFPLFLTSRWIFEKK